MSAPPAIAGTARTRLSADTPAPGVYRIGVHGRLDLLAGVRLLRLLDSRLAASAAGGARAEQVLVDLTDADGAERVGVQLLGRAAATAAHHRSRFALLCRQDPLEWCAERDRHHLADLDVVASVEEAVGPGCVDPPAVGADPGGATMRRPGRQGR